ncbi:hypothetical protein NMY22_g7856 [Coprinellus aureogranulatus]|nr:hypothetical protein NMY22_g7856 [Coprinellus aureogranulatus]
MSINNHNAPSDLRRAQEQPGSSKQNPKTIPVEPDSDERPHSVPVGSLRPEKVVSAIADIIRKYNHGDVSRSYAVSRITSALQFTEERDAAKERALESYLKQLDQIDNIQRRSPAGSSHTARSRGPHHSPSHSSSGSDSESHASSKHSWKSYQYDPDDPSGDDGPSSSSRSDASGRGRPRKRAKLEESDMPWFEEEARGRKNGRESCVKSSALLRKYGRDIGKVKQWILTSTIAPVGFPTSEWENLLRGKPLNLDAIFSSLYHVLPVKENRGKIGDNEISFGYTEPSRKVQTYGDWTIAWNLAAKATEFLFRHRREELQQYAEFIQVGPACYSPTSTASPSIVLPSFPAMAFSPSKTTVLRGALGPMSSATVSTRSGDALTRRARVSIGMFAGGAGVEDMEREYARGRSEIVRGQVPKYRRYNAWELNSDRLPNTADWTINAKPLPRPPSAELANEINATTIAQNPHLFNVSTPINIDRFEELLVTHPNQPFVHSVVTGLREGFWPCADTTRPEYPITHDAHLATTKNPAELKFLEEQFEIERQKGRFSEPFGPDLLPGMYSMPIHAVPKDNGSTFRMVTDHSAGPFSLNSMIDKENVPPSPLDNMRHVGDRLLKARQMNPSKRLVMWKADVSEAYRHLPLHPHWQLKQVNTLHDRRYIDQRVCFGSRASPALWIAFMSLVTWIAIYVRHIINLIGAYVDDAPGFDEEDDVKLYAPYSEFMPRSQVELLELWDELGLPHKEHKQVFGSPLTIIGLVVDPNAMTITLPGEARTNLINELVLWTKDPIPRSDNSGRFSLRRWQTLAGWMNWAFNVYPALRPALNRVYPKMVGRPSPFSQIYVNNAVRYDLLWALSRIRRLGGTRLITATTWDPREADVFIYADACLEGMGFWYPDHRVGFYAPTPTDPPSKLIYYFEALCVVSALTHATQNGARHARVVIYTDNFNTVDIFSSLRCDPALNHLLLHAVDTFTAYDIDLRVLHVPGEKNVIADAISRGTAEMSRHGRRTKRVATRPVWSLVDLQRERSRLVDLTVAASTSHSYSSAFDSYLDFCQRHNLDFAPTPDVMSLYISYMSSYINPRSVASYLSGICHCLEPSFPHVRDVRSSPLVKRTLRGALRSKGTAINRKLAITPADLRSILKQPPPDPSPLDNALFYAILLTGFFGLLRLGEMTTPSTKALINPMSSIQRQSLKLSSSTYQFLLPANKTDPYFEGNRIIIRATSDDLNPRPYFLNYIALRDAAFPFHGQLFLTSDGTNPTYGWFVRRLHQYLPPTYGGQSLRAGGATWLASIGTNSSIIQATGRWSSDTWHRYIRQHPLLLYHLSH